VLNNILLMAVQSKYGGTIVSGEIGLPVTQSKLTLPCGILGRWEE
jgi:23S rRNA (cytosine1962-C5)-methyltransferase